MFYQLFDIKYINSLFASLIKKMIKKPTIMKNMGALILSRIIETIGAITMLGLITRYLGTKDYGEYALIMNVVYVFVTIINFGFSEILIREISKAKENADKIIVAVFTLKFFFIFISIVLVSGIVYFSNIPSIQRSTLLVALLSGFTLVYVTSFLDIFISYERMWFNTLIVGINQIATIVLIILTIQYNLGIIALFASVVIANSISLLFSFFIVINVFLKTRITKQIGQIVYWVKYFIKEAYPIALAMIIYDMLLRLDIFILKIFQDYNEVGLFDAPQRLIIRLAAVAVTFVNVLQPTYSRLAVSSLNNLLYVFKHSFKILLGFILPIAFFTVLFSKRIIVLFLGNEFIDASYTLSFLIWVLVFLFTNVLLGNMLVSLGRQKLILKGFIICFIVNAILDLIFIPIYGAVGASLAKVISFGILSCYLYDSVSNILGRIPIYKITRKLMIASLIMIVILFLLKSINIFLLVGLGFSIYIGALFILKNFTMEEITQLKKILIE